MQEPESEVRRRSFVTGAEATTLSPAVRTNARVNTFVLDECNSRTKYYNLCSKFEDFRSKKHTQFRVIVRWISAWMKCEKAQIGVVNKTLISWDIHNDIYRNAHKSLDGQWAFQIGAHPKNPPCHKNLRMVRSRRRLEWSSPLHRKRLFSFYSTQQLEAIRVQLLAVKNQWFEHARSNIMHYLL
jgi:hypothetical protein